MTAGAPTLGGLRRLTTATFKNLSATGNLSISGTLTAGAADLAALGTNQATAAAIVKTVSNVTGADGTVAVRLPIATPGAIYIVYNSVATNGLPVFPATGGTINGGSGDAAVTLEGKTLAIFVGTSTANWGAIFTANT